MRCDPSDLTIELAGAGFVVGLSLVGLDPVGDESAERVAVEHHLSSLSISREASVDSALFVKPDVPVMTMRAIYQNAPEIFRGQIVLVKHRGEDILFRGRVLGATRSVQLDTKKPGNRAWSVSISAAPSDSRHAGFQIGTPQVYDEAAPATAILDRLPYVRSVEDNVGVSAFRIAAGHDDKLTGQEFLDRVMSLTSTYIHSDTLDDGALIIDPYDYGAHWELSDQAFPSYSSVSFVEDGALATEVTLSVMHVPEGEQQVAVTKTTTGATRNDKAFTVDVPHDTAAAQLALALARMPVAKPPQEEYVSSIVVPYSAGLDYSVSPTSFTLWLDGRRYDGAVIGVSHEIAPVRASDGTMALLWTTTLKCAPAALLTRESE